MTVAPSVPFFPCISGYYFFCNHFSNWVQQKNKTKFQSNKQIWMLVTASVTSDGYIRLYIDSAQKYKLCSVLTLTAPGPVNMDKRCFSCVVYWRHDLKKKASCRSNCGTNTHEFLSPCMRVLAYCVSGLLCFCLLFCLVTVFFFLAIIHCTCRLMIRLWQKWIEFLQNNFIHSRLCWLPTHTALSLSGFFSVLLHVCSPC